MITSLKFHNFRILQDATLPLGKVTVIIGPNGSGKSTALEGIKQIANRRAGGTNNWLPLQMRNEGAPISIEVTSSEYPESAVFDFQHIQQNTSFKLMVDNPILESMRTARVLSLNATEIAKPSVLQRTLELEASGGNLASVLTSLQDEHPERFNSLNQDLHRCLPEFDRILLETRDPNQRAFTLRTTTGKYKVPADHVSQGNLIAVALLTLSHLPDPPSIVALEEVDLGIHPRLFREVFDAVNRLAFPTDHGEDRKPVQVILTTHSPYFVDLFRDVPEDIVIAEKEGITATFHRLTDMPYADEILRGAHLGDAWFAGILGGVPAGT